MPENNVVEHTNANTSLFSQIAENDNLPHENTLSAKLFSFIDKGFRREILICSIAIMGLVVMNSELSTSYIFAYQYLGIFGLFVLTLKGNTEQIPPLPTNKGEYNV